MKQKQQICCNSLCIHQQAFHLADYVAKSRYPGYEGHNSVCVITFYSDFQTNAECSSAMMVTRREDQYHRTCKCLSKKFRKTSAYTVEDKLIYLVRKHYRNNPSAAFEDCTLSIRAITTSDSLNMRMNLQGKLRPWITTTMPRSQTQ